MAVGTGDDAAFKISDQDGAAVDGDADQVIQAIGVGQGKGTAGGIALPSPAAEPPARPASLTLSLPRRRYPGRR
ncbi:hypothetical protein [Marinobacterium rhizophilum]|uniref:Uncharacterized protein n=1 Tax=Marinobacterium rhizophilum TaxID=420402 RepID=A0ABY5HGM8_9GAMM|nr:hypothetical protein [Marinobacterium rhizophilum]UTW11274.1 hypothetical protein KDW95_18710 [Marinobacterium rhizophilum]